MTAEKAELKSLIARNFAEEMRISGDRAVQGIHSNKGAALAFLQAEKILNEQTQTTRTKLIEGKLDVDLTQPVELAKFIVGELMAAAKKIHELGDNAATSAVRAEGEVKAWQTAEKLHLKVFAEEQSKAEALRAAARAALEQGGDGDVDARDLGGPGAPRPPGGHPGLPVKAQRMAEAALEDAKADSKAKAKPKGRPRKSAAKKSGAVTKATTQQTSIKASPPDGKGPNAQDSRQ